MDKLIRGQWHCQKIKFEISPTTEFCSRCHCESCRRTHGAAFVAWTSVPNSQFKVVQESSPNIFWMSCTNCGSPLFQTTASAPDRTYITVASLIDKLDREPDSHVSYEEHVEWIKINDGLPQHKAKASERLN